MTQKRLMRIGGSCGEIKSPSVFTKAMLDLLLLDILLMWRMRASHIEIDIHVALSIFRAVHINDSWQLSMMISLSK